MKDVDPPERSDGQLQPQSHVRVAGEKPLEPQMSIGARPWGADEVHHEVESSHVGAQGADQALDVGLVSSLLPADHVGVQAHAQGLHEGTAARYAAMVLSKAKSHVSAAARLIPCRRSSSVSFGSLAVRLRHAASSSAEVGSNVKAAPEEVSSRTAIRLWTTAAPAARPSATGSPKPSSLEGTTRAVAPTMRSSSSSLGTKPRWRTRPVRPRALTSTSRALVCLGSQRPAMRSSSARSEQFAIAASRTDRFLLGFGPPRYKK